MAKKAKIDYDQENDILYLYSGEKVKDSIEIENFVIDFSSANKIIGIEILDASEILSKILDIKISKNALQNIKSAEIAIYQGKEILYIVLLLYLTINKKKQELRIPVPAPVAIAR